MTSDTQTENRPTDPEASTDGAAGSNSMGGVDHTHPDRNTTFGSIFGRGPSIAADGGKPATAAEPDEDEIMEDVDHEAPSETGANATFERGAEHAGASETDETVVAEDTTNE